MEAASAHPGPARRWPYYALAVVGLLGALLFAVVAINIAGTETCEEALSGDEIFVECFDGSSSNKTLTVIASILTALAALATAIAAIGYTRGRTSSSTLRNVAIVTAVLVAITLIM